jgi:ABC-type arginine transport system ATPase subunit
LEAAIASSFVFVVFAVALVARAVDCLVVVVELGSPGSGSSSFLRVTTVVGVQVEGDVTAAFTPSTCACNEAMLDMCRSFSV